LIGEGGGREEEEEERVFEEGVVRLRDFPFSAFFLFFLFLFFLFLIMCWWSSLIGGKSGPIEFHAGIQNTQVFGKDGLNV
jgi:hypothetical protein